jgi:hypothetical protein
MAYRKQCGVARDKTICLPIADDIDCAKLVEDRASYRAYLNGQIAQHLELFPVGIIECWMLMSWRTSGDRLAAMERTGLRLAMATPARSNRIQLLTFWSHR